MRGCGDMASLLSHKTSIYYDKLPPKAFTLTSNKNWRIYMLIGVNVGFFLSLNIKVSFI
jgi:hypothetical protein